MWIRWVVGKVDLLAVEVGILHAIRDISGVSDLLDIALGSLELAGHRVGDTCAAEDGGADQSGDDAGSEGARHDPEGPAQVEGVLGVAAGANVLVLRVEDVEP